MDIQIFQNFALPPEMDIQIFVNFALSPTPESEAKASTGKRAAREVPDDEPSTKKHRTDQGEIEASAEVLVEREQLHETHEADLETTGGDSCVTKDTGSTTKTGEHSQTHQRYGEVSARAAFLAYVRENAANLGPGAKLFPKLFQKLH